MCIKAEEVVCLKYAIISGRMHMHLVTWLPCSLGTRWLIGSWERDSSLYILATF